MIAVDTSALMAIVLDDPEAGGCIAALAAGGELIISAATVAEALIVSGRRGVAGLIDGLDLEIADVTAASARRAADACRRWGKDVHPAGLNVGDCFAYEAARAQGCALLLVGRDLP